MTHMPPHRRLGLGLSALCAALLTACGGGGGGDSGASTGASGSATPTSASTVCAVTPSVQTGAEAYLVETDASMVINAYTVDIDRLTSSTGHTSSASLITLSDDLEDMRQQAYSSNYTPQTGVGVMGVEMNSQVGAGSVACVAGLMRVNETYDRDAQGNTIYPAKKSVSWSSQAMVNLPLNAMYAASPGTQTFNGFELIHNMPGKLADAVFRVDNSLLSSANGALICHLSSAGGGTADCQPAEAVSSTNQWELRRRNVGAGVYVLRTPA